MRKLYLVAALAMIATGAGAADQPAPMGPPAGQSFDDWVVSQHMALAAAESAAITAPGERKQRALAAKVAAEDARVVALVRAAQVKGGN